MSGFCRLERDRSLATRVDGGGGVMTGALAPIALSLRGVTKRFGAIRALDGVDLEVPRGAVFGLVGPNGAGKTTTFGIACGYVRPDGGTVDLFGEGPFDPSKHRGRVAVLPQDAQLGRDIPLLDQLVYFARLQGLGKQEARSQAGWALELAGVTSRARARSRTLSHGMLKRVAIAQAFIGEAELVLLDEPTSGLDPVQAERIREHIVAQRHDRTVVVSSHNLNEIEAVCDHVAMIDHGRAVLAGTVAAITGKNEEVRITLAEGPVPLDMVKTALAGDSVDWDEASRTLVIRFVSRPGRGAEDVIGQALRTLLGHHARISQVVKGRSLERTYLESS